MDNDDYDADADAADPDDAVILCRCIIMYNV